MRSLRPFTFLFSVAFQDLLNGGSDSLAVVFEEYSIIHVFDTGLWTRFSILLR